ncbi:hypothetical protein, partial [Streptomyces sp. bgisy084]|uniref:hypothetical protein n=1 Tax=unclassified Streptomyces TaxID=2593676 RepID=UPI003D71BB4B
HHKVRGFSAFWVCFPPAHRPASHGARAEAPWDPDLAGALEDSGGRVEEAVLGDLLSDLLSGLG